MKYLGIDFGLRRIGFAHSFGEIAAPLKVIEVLSFKKALEEIKKMAKDFDQIVIGKPEGKVGKKVSKLIQKLQKDGINVTPWDETLSSQKALEQMIAEGKGKKKRKITDDYSAALILQDYLDFR